jgi:hypothetical protein
MHKEFITENMANKFYFEQGDSSSYQRLMDVNIYRAWDDEHIGMVELMYNYDKINERDEFKIEFTRWSEKITIREAEDAISELLNAARDGQFHEFASECTNYEHFDEEESWFV